MPTSLAKHDPAAREINILMNLLNSTNGRDKLTKAIQYSLKILIDFTDAGSMWNKKFSSAQGQISAARKVFRFFKFLTAYPALLQIIDRISSWKSIPTKQVKPWLDLSSDFKALFLGIYLFYDTINWAGKANLLPEKERPLWRITQANYKKKVEGGYHFWMLSTFIGFITDWIKIFQWYNAYQHQLKTNKDKSRREIHDEMMPAFYKLLRALLKDGCDALVSSHFAGYWSPRQRYIGLFGTISSIAGGWDMYKDARKKA